MQPSPTRAPAVPKRGRRFCGDWAGNGARLSWHETTPEKAPEFKPVQRRIDAVADCRERSALLDVSEKLELRVGWAAVFALQLKSKHFAVMHGNDVGYASAHTETFKDCGLNRAARATIRRMPRNEPRHTTRANMVKYRALNVVSWPGSSSHAGQPFPR
jgi:hypothetical protein